MIVTQIFRFVNGFPKIFAETVFAQRVKIGNRMDTGRHRRLHFFLCCRKRGGRARKGARKPKKRSKAVDKSKNVCYTISGCTVRRNPEDTNYNGGGLLLSCIYMKGVSFSLQIFEGRWYRWHLLRWFLFWCFWSLFPIWFYRFSINAIVNKKITACSTKS